MIQARDVRVAALLCCLAGACNRPPSDPAPSTAATKAAPSRGEYVNPDGTLNYAKLRAIYGEPNQHLVYNPRAFNVGDTTSRNGVTIDSDRLTFATPHSGWLRRLGPGDILYCNRDCGGTGFIRRIVSIHQTPYQEVVLTSPGSVGDVVVSGWLHADGPALTRDTHKVPHLEYKNSFSFPTASQSGSVPMPSPVQGNITGTASFASSIAIDIITSGFHIQTVSVIATGVPEVQAQLDATATASYKQDWTLIPERDFPLGDFQLGPVPVVPTLSISGTAHAEASGTVEVHASADAKLTMQAGFQYDATNGGSPVWNPSPSFTQSLSISGSANALAYVDLKADLKFQIADAAGPEVGIEGQLGAKGAANFSTSEGAMGQQCSTDINGQLYFAVGGNAGLNLTLPIVGQLAEKTWPLSQNTYPIYSFDFPADPAVLHLCLGTPDAGPMAKDAGSTMMMGGMDAGSSGGMDAGMAPVDAGSPTAGTADICASCSSNGDCASGNCNSTTSLCDVAAGTSCAGSNCGPVGGTCDSTDSTCACPGSGSSDGGAGADAGSSGSLVDLCIPCGQPGDCLSGNCNMTTGVCDVTSGTSCAASDCSTQGGTCDSTDSFCQCASGGSCTGGQQDCQDGQGCHDLSADPNNCGACGNSCATVTGSVSSSCGGGACTCICPDGSGALCPDGMSSSSCTASMANCPNGMLDCDQTGQCATDPTSDPNNCGGCGIVCGSGDGTDSCQNSACYCPDGVTACSDTTCGACGLSSSGTTCTNGLLDCSGSGVCDTDPTSDPNNCGGCGNQDSQYNCALVTQSSASTCSGSACQCVCPDGSGPCPGADATSCASACASGTADCDGSGQCETNIQDGDPSNCGGCGSLSSQYVCAPGLTCQSGQCTCPDGSAVCGDGTCPNPDSQTDPTHCGAGCEDCLNDVGPQAQCVSGACQCFCSDGVTACPNDDITQCTDGLQCSGDTQDCAGTGQTCNDLDNDPDNCGQCNNVCPTGAGGGGVCQSGTCVCDTNGTPLCGNDCPDYTSDPNNCAVCGSVCPAGYCVNSQCSCDSSGTQACSDGTCPSDTDANHCGTDCEDCTQTVGPDGTCDGSGNCTCACLCSDGVTSCPNCDSTQCPGGKPPPRFHPPVRVRTAAR